MENTKLTNGVEGDDPDKVIGAILDEIADALAGDDLEQLDLSEARLAQFGKARIIAVQQARIALLYANAGKVA